MKVKNMRDFGYLTQSSAINRKHQNQRDGPIESSVESSLSVIKSVNEESKTDQSMSNGQSIMDQSNSS